MGKQNRGKYGCISVPKTHAPTEVASGASYATAAYHNTVSTTMPVDPATGKMKMPWIGKEWSTNYKGIIPKCVTPSLAECAARFPGIPLPENDANDDAEMADDENAGMEESKEDSTVVKKPTTSLSRRAPSRSRAGTRSATPAAGTSPSLGPASAASSSSAAAAAISAMDDSSFSLTPSRTPVTGATWKSLSSDRSLPSRSLIASGNRSKTLHKTWNQKRQLKDAAADAKKKQSALAEAMSEEKRERARATAQKLAYKKEQEQKNQQVQVISDTRKIKAMSRKQLRSITKMDVTQRHKQGAVTSKTLSRGTIPKGQ